MWAPRGQGAALTHPGISGGSSKACFLGVFNKHVMNEEMENGVTGSSQNPCPAELHFLKGQPLQNLAVDVSSRLVCPCGILLVGWWVILMIFVVFSYIIGTHLSVTEKGQFSFLRSVRLCNAVGCSCKLFMRPTRARPHFPSPLNVK